MTIDLKKLTAQQRPGPEGIRRGVVEALRRVFDPEIPLNIYDLGLIYSLDIDELRGVVHVRMTLTSPACPVAQTFPCTVECALREVPGVKEVTVELVWDPPWSQDSMSEAAKLELGLL
ncbi:MAG: DUF59 domain-containing protein [Acidiferrobacterales bacterium]